MVSFLVFSHHIAEVVLHIDLFELVSYRPSRLLTSYIAEADLELLILLPPPPQCLDDNHAPPHSVYAVVMEQT